VTVVETAGVDVVRSLFDAWNAHELATMYDHLSDDYTEYVNGKLTKRSRAEAQRLDQVLYEVLRDYTVTVQELWGLGDRVVSRFVVSGTMVDRRRFELAVAGVYGVGGARLTEGHLFYDPATAVKTS
jgi:ketosteroid isomerase-like protein